LYAVTAGLSALTTGSPELPAPPLPEPKAGRTTIATTAQKLKRRFILYSPAQHTLTSDNNQRLTGWRIFLQVWHLEFFPFRNRAFHL
jgi:hypothetical protein